MTENRKNWLYPEASGLYFPHDGFVMRALDGKQYDIDEECELLNAYHKGYNECRDDVLRLEKENEQLKEENKELKEKIQLLRSELNADAKQYQIFIDIIDEADDLICSHLSKHYQRKWRNFCKNKEYDLE